MLNDAMVWPLRGRTWFFRQELADYSENRVESLKKYAPTVTTWEHASGLTVVMMPIPGAK
jgi:hypothetical protein